MSRHDLGGKTSLDPYIAIDVDEELVERTSTKQKTRDPEWNETFATDLLRSAEEIGFTVRSEQQTSYPV